MSSFVQRMAEAKRAKKKRPENVSRPRKPNVPRKEAGPSALKKLRCTLLPDQDRGQPAAAGEPAAAAAAAHATDRATYDSERPFGIERGAHLHFDKVLRKMYVDFVRAEQQRRQRLLVKHAQQEWEMYRAKRMCSWCGTARAPPPVDDQHYRGKCTKQYYVKTFIKCAWEDKWYGPEFILLPPERYVNKVVPDTHRIPHPYAGKCADVEGFFSLPATRERLLACKAAGSGAFSSTIENIYTFAFTKKMYEPLDSADEKLYDLFPLYLPLAFALDY